MRNNLISRGEKARNDHYVIDTDSSVVSNKVGAATQQKNDVMHRLVQFLAFNSVHNKKNDPLEE